MAFMPDCTIYSKIGFPLMVFLNRRSPIAPTELIDNSTHYYCGTDVIVSDGCAQADHLCDNVQKDSLNPLRHGQEIAADRIVVQGKNADGYYQ